MSFVQAQQGGRKKMMNLFLVLEETLEVKFYGSFSLWIVNRTQLEMFRCILVKEVFIRW